MIRFTVIAILYAVVTGFATLPQVRAQSPNPALLRDACWHRHGIPHHDRATGPRGIITYSGHTGL
jgi:hypothetical protein